MSIDLCIICIIELFLKLLNNVILLRSFFKIYFICAICKNKFNLNLKPTVDHDHKTGEIRSLLCNYCNPMLGCAFDSIEILENAIRYLKRFQK